MSTRVLTTFAFIAAAMMIIVTAATMDPARVAADTTICHKVAGAGNTGNGYNLITVNDRQLARHRQHEGDLIPAPNGFCLVLFPPTTTPPAPRTTPPPPRTTVPNPPPVTTRPSTAPPSPPPTSRTSTTVPTIAPTTTPAAGTHPVLTGTLPPSR